MANAVQRYEGAVDRGLEGVVACTTGISSIMGATLTYRGYTIEDLAEKASFEDVIHLLWNGNAPTADQKKETQKNISQSLHLSPELKKALAQLPTNVHPMAWLRSAVSVLGLFDKEAEVDSESARKSVAFRLVAQIPLLIAFYANIRKSKEVPETQPEKGIAWNFLYLLNGVEPSAKMIDILDTCLVLHADHELNCSAFASRVTASALSDIYSSVVSAIGTLKGPLHGGANERVMLMLDEIGGVDKVEAWLDEALDKKTKIMGFGHRVYKEGDPRAKILRTLSKDLTAERGTSHLYDMSMKLDDLMTSKKGILPNVDFYSATVYNSLGIETDLFTPIFAMSRVSGWLAHIMEQYSKNRIYRPRGEWTGASQRQWP